VVFASQPTWQSVRAYQTVTNSPLLLINAEMLLEFHCISSAVIYELDVSELRLKWAFLLLFSEMEL
jgi:hypothetical protein